ncbi:type II toxin-antitoxin system Phd/YefM family antitoxin [Klebsiella variicola]|uniref:type II toxin-antitoxin system Phd/YefM family antitoxin n=1 Tax=Klebsiella variicola TaxID=244366 RepID=UPI00396C6A56
MRKISYTQMRAELSDILDAIRDGETFVVTQRGKPDTVLNGWREKNACCHLVDSTMSKEIKYRECDDDFTKIVPVVGSVIAGTLSTHAFEDALKRTKKKHAKIIKALEDK